MNILNKLLNRFRSARYMRRSYSQCGEDLIIQFIFDNLVGKSKVTYMDLGAFHPFKYNNTYLAYLRGGRGINVDANPLSIQQFRKWRPRDTNVNAGVGTTSGTMPFHVMAKSELNTFSEPEAKRMAANEGVPILKIIPVEVRTFGQLLEQYSPGRTPDLLSIDVEGLDLQIVQSIDFSVHKPDVICVETIRFSSSAVVQKEAGIVDHLKECGYYHHSDTLINSIFLQRKYLKS